MARSRGSERSRSRSSTQIPSKTCARCGRTIEWRKKWEREWDNVRFCSKACRSTKPTAVDHELETVIVDLLRQRRQGASICPSDAARHLESDEEAWRALMEPARRAARRLVAEGTVEITQRGVVVDPSTARGPIRIRLVEGG